MNPFRSLTIFRIFDLSSKQNIAEYFAKPGTFTGAPRMVYMTKQNFEFPKSLIASTATLLALAVPMTASADAEETQLVVSPASAEAVKSGVNYRGEDLVVDGEIIRSLGAVDAAADLETPLNKPLEDGVPALEFVTADNATVTLGLLASGTDTADGITRRDPYAIENIEVDPIYPEGIYVDAMRATAGLGVTSEF